MTDLAHRLRNIARLLGHIPHIPGRGDCGCPPCRANTWDTTWYPSSTLGNGIRSADRTSTTERHALALLPDKPGAKPPPALTFHYRYQAALASLELASITLHNLLVELGYDPTHPQAKATLDDPVAVGRGSCLRCDLFCIGDGETNRLRSGLCHRCYARWNRWRKLNPAGNSTDFIRQVPA